MMGSGWRGGMMGGSGGMMGRYFGDGYGPMHQYMIEALAEALGLTPEELQERINNGETPYQIAEGKGLSEEEVSTLFEEAHDKALDKAVEAGLITQEQADWMDQHHEQMWQNGFGPGPGGCPMGGGGPGRGGRWNTEPAPQQ
jgi:predicted lipid-binding transport protein (Tim44 family)